MSLRYQQEHVQQRVTTILKPYARQGHTTLVCVYVGMWHVHCIRMSHTSGAAEKLLFACMCASVCGFSLCLAYPDRMCVI